MKLITLECPNCKKEIRIRENRKSKEVICKKCKSTFVIEYETENPEQNKRPPKITLNRFITNLKNHFASLFVISSIFIMFIFTFVILGCDIPHSPRLKALLLPVLFIIIIPLVNIFFILVPILKPPKKKPSILKGFKALADDIVNYDDNQKTIKLKEKVDALYKLSTLQLWDLFQLQQQEYLEFVTNSCISLRALNKSLHLENYNDMLSDGGYILSASKLTRIAINLESSELGKKNAAQNAIKELISNQKNYITSFTNLIKEAEKFPTQLGNIKAIYAQENINLEQVPPFVDENLLKPTKLFKNLLKEKQKKKTSPAKIKEILTQLSEYIPAP